jgi:ribose transport system permease protein
MASAERAVPAPPGVDRGAVWRHVSLQNAPLILSLLILLGTTGLYIVFFNSNTGGLPGSFELTSLANTTLPLIFAALGQTVVVLTRGIDLSVGGMMDLSNSLAAAEMHATLGSELLWSAIIIAIGAAGGLLNGLLVVYARLQPILVTIATLSIFQGLAIAVLPQPGGAIPSAYTNVLTNPNQPTSLAYVALVILAWVAFRRSSFGIATFAVGNDQDAARARGIAVDRTKVCVYMLSGMLAAIAGLFLAASATAGDATTGDVYILQSIAAVVLGGISFAGGRGSGVGAVAGAFTLTLLVNVLFFAGINPLYQQFYQGLFLITAIVLGAGIARLGRAGRIGR